MGHDNLQSDELRKKAVELEIQNEELRRAKAELEESRQKYADLYDFAPMGYFVLDEKGVIVEANLTGAIITGIEKNFLVNQPFTLSVCKEDQDNFNLILRQVFKAGVLQQCELNMLRKGKSEFLAKLIIDPIKDAADKVIQCRIAVVDITERKKSDLLLQNTLMFKQEIIKNAGEGVVVYDSQLRYQEWNAFMENLTGMKKEDVVGKVAAELFPHIREDGLDKLLERALAGETVSSHDSEYRCPQTGKSGWILGTYTPHRSSKGEIIGVIGMIRDITGRKQKEAEILWKTAFLESQIEASLDGLLVVDSNEQRIILINKRLIDLFEIPKHIAEDKNDKTLLEYVVSRTKYPEKFLEQVKYLHAHQDETSRDELEFKNGMVFDRYSSPVIDKNGKYYGRIWTFRDITERKAAEEELRKSNESLIISTAHAQDMAAEAQRANIAKSQFLETMSHELRTPLNSVIGFSEILLDELSGDQKKYIELINHSGKHLLQLISDILDLSKIESEKINIRTEPCSIKELTNQIETMMRPFAAQKGLTFAIREKSALPANIITDSTRLEQCLINLVNNAIKFTERGYVYVNISTEDRDNKPYIRFEVEDSGIGIAPEYQERIFESFTQEDGTTSRKYGGVGLGLTISKKLAGFLGGDILLTSEKGKGSTFTLLIPAIVETAALQVGAESADSAGFF
jgi:PAS domain S-box-containing protein